MLGVGRIIETNNTAYPAFSWGVAIDTVIVATTRAIVICEELADEIDAVDSVACSHACLVAM